MASAKNSAAVAMAAAIAAGRRPRPVLSTRSIPASRPSTASASSAAGTAPARIIVEFTIDSPRKMYSPRPPAPIAAAIVAVPTPMTAATRMPATIDGSASGNSTIHKRWRDVIPIAIPASRIARSRFLSPATVVRTTGSSA
jgi:hypothetical protein